MVKRKILQNRSYDMLATALVFLYFVLSEMSRHIPNMLIRYSGRAMMYLCVAYVILRSRPYRLTKQMLVCLIFCVVTGIINILFVGNLEPSTLIYIVLCLFFAQMILSCRIDPRFLLIAFYIYAAIVLYFFARNGLFSPVFTTSSNNFISVYLSFPLVVYYVLTEKNGGSIRIFPALAYWLMTITARGRGGIICGSLLLIMILLNALLAGKRQSGKLNKLLLVLLFFAMLVLLGWTVAYGNLLKMNVFQKFARLGFDSNGRNAVWKQYLDSVFGSTRNLLLGSNFDDLSVVIAYLDNLHNSYLNIHAFGGILMLCYVVAVFIQNGFFALKKKRYVYLACLLAFMMRSFTDFVFWGGAPGTIIFFVLMLYPAHLKAQASSEPGERSGVS